MIWAEVAGVSILMLRENLAETRENNLSFVVAKSYQETHIPNEAQLNEPSFTRTYLNDFVYTIYLFPVFD